MPEGGRDPFARLDPSDDAHFYAIERKVVHLEPGAIDALRAFYASILVPGACVLDLMSSWRSHLPDGLGPVTGLGMNLAEMTENPQLTSVVLHDLNRFPRLPFDTASFDAVVCAVSVQYLLRPLDVLIDVCRVLRPSGPVVISFSNRCFPTKAVAVWLANDEGGHRDLVRAYLDGSGFERVDDRRLPTADDPLRVVWARRPAQ